MLVDRATVVAIAHLVLSPVLSREHRTFDWLDP
jgi:hypothetical protein